jgi:hypothetical protein
MYPGIHRTCERVVRIDAKPDAKTLFMMIDLNIDDGDVPFTSFSFTLRRMAQEEPGKVSTALPARR